MSPTERAYSTIGGVSLRYLRSDPVIPRVTIRSTGDFEDKLDNFSLELQRVAPGSYGPITYIATAGAYVNKPGAHGMGRAFDLDLIRWRDRTIAPYWGHHRSDDPSMRRRYLGVDALLRRWFKYVLDGWYNAAHGDHIHVDDIGGALVLNKGYRSDTVFVQAVCHNLMDTRLAVDGIWGANTERAFRQSLDRLGTPGPMTTSASQWREWLYGVAVRGLQNQSL